LTRHELAIWLRRIVADAEHPRAALRSAPVCRAAVLSWREGMLGLAQRLEQPGTVNPCGVARVLVMLSDRSGPLYRPERERLLGELVWWVTEGLMTCPPHRWACPVIMKLDPEHAAWTCGRCGAIARTDDAAVRPA
jgi:hypothetical protein